MRSINIYIPFGLVVLVLAVLKLLGYLSLGWLWVLSPLWIPLAFICGVVAIIFIIIAVIVLAYGLLAMIGIIVDYFRG